MMRAPLVILVATAFFAAVFMCVLLWLLGFACASLLENLLRRRQGYRAWCELRPEEQAMAPRLLAPGTYWWRVRYPPPFEPGRDLLKKVVRFDYKERRFA
jgi:hypothetical protein